MSRWISAILFVLFSCSAGFSQVGKDTGYWEFVYDDPAAKSIVTVACADGVASGFIVEYGGSRYLLTAAHVVSVADAFTGRLTDVVSEDIRVCFRGGTIAKAKVIGKDLVDDICVLECEIPEHIAAFKVATNQPKPGDELQVIGLGGITLFSAPIRHWKAKAAWGCCETTIVDTGVIPGDSGGAILNSDGEVVGIVSGGWRWIEDRRFMEDGRAISVTWPAIGAGPFQIRRVLAGVK